MFTLLWYRAADFSIFDVLVVYNLHICAVIKYKI